MVLEVKYQSSSLHIQIFTEKIWYKVQPWLKTTTVRCSLKRKNWHEILVLLVRIRTTSAQLTIYRTELHTQQKLLALTCPRQNHVQIHIAETYSSKHKSYAMLTTNSRPQCGDDLTYTHFKVSLSLSVPPPIHPQPPPLNKCVFKYMLKMLSS